LNDRSALRRFLRTCRRFGLRVAVNVAYSKVRGWLFPASALPDRPLYDNRPRELSVLLDGAEHSPADLNAIVAAIAGRGGQHWEICICEHHPLPPQTAHALARWHGKHAWLRIVSSDASVDAATAARSTLEQATGLFVALVTPGYTPSPEILAALLARLREAPQERAALYGGEHHFRCPPRRKQAAVCRLLLLRKASYLLLPDEAGLLAAASVAARLDDPVMATEAGAGDPGELRASLS
jgi:hypothetical protein